MLIVTEKTEELMKKTAFREIIERGIQNEEELYFVCQDILGMRVPTEVCCEDHQPLWTALADDFFHRVPKQAIRHCRGGGKTAVVGLGKSVKLLNYGGLRVSNFAATENQGLALYGYVNGHLGPGANSEVQRRVEKVEGTMAKMVPQLAKGRLRPEAAVMRVLVGTMKGVNSAHVDDLVQDERAQMDDNVAKESIGMMTAKAPYPGVLTVLSTVKQAGDGMDRLLENAEENGYKTYVSCILDVTNCQEKNCDGCKQTWSYSADRQQRKNFFDFCGGRILGRDLGHFSVQTARNKFSEMGLENAKAQLFCRQPEGDDTAFPAFSQTHNVSDLDERVAGDAFFIFGDFGKSDASAFLRGYHMDDGKIYVNDEIVAGGKTIQEWIPVLKDRAFSRAAAWLVDVAGRQTTITSKMSAIDYMEDEGWTVCSQKMDELETTERLRELIGRADPHVIVHPRCKRLIEALERATNKSTGHGDDKVITKVIKHNKYSHPIDALRYGVFLLNPDDHADLPDKYRIGGGKKKKRQKWN